MKKKNLVKKNGMKNKHCDYFFAQTEEQNRIRTEIREQRQKTKENLIYETRAKKNKM